MKQYIKQIINKYLNKVNKYFKELIEKLRKIESDKYLHFNICFILSLSLISALDVFLHYSLALFIGGLLTFIIGIPNELLDKNFYNLFYLEDLKAYIYGIISGICFYTFFKFLILINS